jgi:hypothetical protein
MRHMVFRRTSVRVVLIAAMAAGMSLTSASVASAQVRPNIVNNWYVAKNGTNTGRNCSNASKPCKTIVYALAEQRAEDVTGIIHVAKGTYNGQLIFSTADDGVTIEGAGESETTISPGTATLTSDTDTDNPGAVELPIVDVTPGVHGFKIEDLSVNGTADIPNMTNCSDDYVGIYLHAASGQITDVSVTGIDMAQSSFGCQGGVGIYVNSTDADPATVTMTGVNESVAGDTTTTTANLPADTYDGNDILPVKSIPANFVNGQGIVVNGYELTATKDTSTSLFIDGTTYTDSPKGSTVNYDPYQPAFNKAGIVCDDNWSTCTIRSSDVQGEGPTNGIAQVGIQGFGDAAITLGGATPAQGNTVSGFSYSGGTYVATAILLFNNGPTLVENNNVSASDVSIYAGEVAAFGPPNPVLPTGAWTIDDNNVTDSLCSGGNISGSTCAIGAGEGIEIDSTALDVQVDSNVLTSNLGSGIILYGVQNATLQSNDITGTGNDVGITLTGPGSQCYYQYANPDDCTYEAGNANQYASEDNTVLDNDISSNYIGVEVDGTYSPTFAGGSQPDVALDNAFGGNQWGGNSVAGIADFSVSGVATDTNTYGPTDGSMDNYCDPSDNGSSSLNTAAGGTGYWGC